MKYETKTVKEMREILTEKYGRDVNDNEVIEALDNLVRLFGIFYFIKNRIETKKGEKF